MFGPNLGLRLEAGTKLNKMETKTTVTTQLEHIYMRDKLLTFDNVV